MTEPNLQNENKSTTEICSS